MDSTWSLRFTPSTIVAMIATQTKVAIRPSSSSQRLRRAIVSNSSRPTVWRSNHVERRVRSGDSRSANTVSIPMRTR